MFNSLSTQDPIWELETSRKHNGCCAVDREFVYIVFSDPRAPLIAPCKDFGRLSHALGLSWDPSGPPWPLSALSPVKLRKALCFSIEIAPRVHRSHAECQLLMLSTVKTQLKHTIKSEPLAVHFWGKKCQIHYTVFHLEGSGSSAPDPQEMHPAIAKRP